MVRTIEKCHFDINNRIASNHTILHLLLDTLIDSRNIFTRNRTTDDCIFKFITFTSFLWLNLNPYVTVLTATTRLSNILTFLLNRSTNGFTISNLRLTDIRFDVEFTLHTVNKNFKM